MPDDTYTLSKEAQDGLRWAVSTRVLLNYFGAGPADIVDKFITSGERHASPDKIVILHELKEKRAECVKFVQGLLGAY